MTDIDTTETLSAPIGVRYQVPRLVALAANATHYGNAFWPFKQEDLKNLSDELRGHLAVRDKTAPVILDQLPTESAPVLEALQEEMAKVERDRLHRIQVHRDQVKAIVAGAPESLWELGHHKANEAIDTEADRATLVQMFGDSVPSYREIVGAPMRFFHTKYYVHGFDLEMLEGRLSPGDEEVADESLKTLNELREEHKGYLVQLRQRAKDATEDSRQRNHEQQMVIWRTWTNNFMAARDWAANRSDGVAQGLQAGYSMIASILQVLEWYIIERFTVLGVVKLVEWDPEDHMQHHQDPDEMLPQWAIDEDPPTSPGKPVLDLLAATQEALEDIENNFPSCVWIQTWDYPIRRVSCQETVRTSEDGTISKDELVKALRLLRYPAANEQIDWSIEQVLRSRVDEMVVEIEDNMESSEQWMVQTASGEGIPLSVEIEDVITMTFLLLPKEEA